MAGEGSQVSFSEFFNNYELPSKVRSLRSIVLTPKAALFNYFTAFGAKLKETRGDYLPDAKVLGTNTSYDSAKVLGCEKEEMEKANLNPHPVRDAFISSNNAAIAVALDLFVVENRELLPGIGPGVAAVLSSLIGELALSS